MVNSLEHISNNKRCYVYRNLSHRFGGPGNFSVRQGGKVVAHVSKIALMDCRFLVGKKGRERVLREKRKNVHAGISGYYIEELFIPGMLEALASESVYYDPYKAEQFAIKGTTDQYVHFADFVLFDLESWPDIVTAVAPKGQNGHSLLIAKRPQP